MVAAGVTVFRQRRDNDFTRNWRDGFTQCLAEVISVAKSGELPSRRPTWVRNLVISAWMIFGMGILAFVTSTVASAMTTASMRGHRTIQTYHDLSGRTVGVLAGSGAEAYLGNLGIRVRTYNRPENARDDLQSGTLEAFVADTAVLEYWLAESPDSHLRLVGPLFHPYKFAFAARQQLTELTDAISVELIRLHENGTERALRAKYFHRTPADGDQVEPTPVVPTTPFPMLVPNAPVQ